MVETFDLFSEQIPVLSNQILDDPMMPRYIMPPLFFIRNLHPILKDTSSHVTHFLVRYN
jgi:hypothetical protein